MKPIGDVGQRTGLLFYSERGWELPLRRLSYHLTRLQLCPTLVLIAPHNGMERPERNKKKSQSNMTGDRLVAAIAATANHVDQLVAAHASGSYSCPHAAHMRRGLIRFIWYNYIYLRAGP